MAQSHRKSRKNKQVEQIPAQWTSAAPLPAHIRFEKFSGVDEIKLHYVDNSGGKSGQIIARRLKIHDKKALLAMSAGINVLPDGESFDYTQSMFDRWCRAPDYRRIRVGIEVRSSFFSVSRCVGRWSARSIRF